MRIIHTWLFLIFFLAAFLRFWQLGHNPPSLTWDEAAWGYNAYSLGIDGKDEFGRFLPYDYLESFGDFKPPVYAYLDILPVKFFGLNEFAVRFPSALFGVLTVLVTYFLVKRIFTANSKSEAQNSKQMQNSNVQNFKHQDLFSHIALLASFLLAISPWHINLSRAAFEANVASFFIIVGVWTFLCGVQGKKWYLILSAISFVLSMYTFNTARIVSPLLVFMLAIGFRKELLAKKKEVLLASFVGVLLLLPALQFLLSPQASLRFQEVNIFSDINIIETTNQEIDNDRNAWWSKILHNRRLKYSIEFVRHYFDNLSPSFLFIKGDGNPKFSTQDVGQLYLWEIPFLIGGILFLFKKREASWWIIPVWLIIGIIPAATARETPHALRIEAALPTFQILTAYGLAHFLSKVSSIKGKNLIYLFVFSFLIFNFLYYYHGYYAHYPRQFSGEWQYGYKESIAYVKKVIGKYDEVRITTHLGRPYAYYLFYTKTDPVVFRKSAQIKRDHFGFVTVDEFNNYRFGDDLQNIKSKGNKNILYINTPSQVPKNVKVLQRFFLLNGDPVLVAYE